MDMNDNNTAANKRLYASWAFSNGPSALEFQSTSVIWL